jgi:hypothetical protein
MNREVHVRICGGRRVRFPPPTRRNARGYPALAWFNLALVLCAEGRQSEAESALTTALDALRQRPIALERQELYTAFRGLFATLADRSPDRRAGVQRLLGRLVVSEGRSVLPDVGESTEGTVSDLTVEQAGSHLKLSATLSGIPDRTRISWQVYYRSGGTTEQPWLQRPGLVSYQYKADDDGTAVLTLTDSTCPVAGQYRADLYIGDRLARSVVVDRKSLPSAFGHDVTMKRESDIIAGMSYCRPSSWSWAAPVSGAVDLSSPDGSVHLSLRFLPLTTEPGTVDARTAIARLVADRLMAGLPNVVGEPKELADVNEDASMMNRGVDLGAGSWAVIRVTVAADSTLRTAVIRGPVAELGVFAEMLEAYDFS